MKTSLVVTLIGPDRPGLVNALATRATACGAGWMESNMAQLAGQFAGIVRLEIDESAAADLEKSLLQLEHEGLHLRLERGIPATTSALRKARLELTGHDRPGIVHEISTVLARHGVSIDKLETACENASFSGEPLFRAHAELHVPLAVHASDLRRDLEALANELMVDLSLEDQPLQ
ncbi:ACT domain-containing protein [Azoarcus sp. DN11]|uniref:glycine cleavage system protein R n=1 Tax=Azoarcus sp. DN11 TaxID=356837 RepID=UPI000EAF3685|nr:ACT domain-containing protein [Azoarcus sp. DN11]AYH44815.1 glycine cleavage system protein R [Azoarcus sp. DN11]